MPASGDERVGIYVGRWAEVELGQDGIGVLAQRGDGAEAWRVAGPVDRRSECVEPTDRRVDGRSTSAFRDRGMVQELVDRPQSADRDVGPTKAFEVILHGAGADSPGDQLIELASVGHPRIVAREPYVVGK